MKHKALIAAVVVGLVAAPTAAMADQRPSSSSSNFQTSNFSKNSGWGRGDSGERGNDRGGDRWGKPGWGSNKPGWGRPGSGWGWGWGKPGGSWGKPGWGWGKPGWGWGKPGWGWGKPGWGHGGPGHGHGPGHGWDPDDGKSDGC
ncbi:hypothetical protein [Novosphingobium lindaniclasticum]|uniref:hypothetical protein n=1 Tax=Novosphingobium lindaniclasticum TaxID=1329895 RepID=UPI001269555B|nr:hypothetical protein [Novosphingobium lindaniclasticum]